MSMIEDAIARLEAAGFPSSTARSIVETLTSGIEDEGAVRRRAVERLIRIHRPEYRRLLAQERGHVPGSAQVDDDEVPLPGDESPDSPDED